MAISQDEEFTVGAGHHDYKLGGAHGISRIQTSETHVHIGDMVFERGEFHRAFEGYLNTGYAPAPSRKFANPVPVGVASFAISLFALSLVNIGARGVHNATALAGLCWFVAGALEVFAGMWCIVIENTWAATLLTSFGGFWIGYGCILVDVFGIAEAYGDNLNNMLAFWVLAWAIFTFIMWLTTLRSTWPLSILIFLVFLTLIVLSAAQFCAVSAPSASANLGKAGGYIGLITSLLAFFVMYEGLCTPENSYWVPPVLLLPGAITATKAE